MAEVMHNNPQIEVSVLTVDRVHDELYVLWQLCLSLVRRLLRHGSVLGVQQEEIVALQAIEGQAARGNVDLVTKVDEM